MEDNVWRPAHLTPKQMEERRLAAARLLRQGQLSQAEIARQLGVSRASVSRWAKTLAQQVPTRMMKPWPPDSDFVVHATGDRTPLLAAYPATIEPRSYGIIHHWLSVSRELQPT